MANSSALEIIPASAICKFVGEGRANLVFTLADVDNHPNLRGQLLRLPKHHNNYKALPYADIQHYWQHRVSPLFKPSELVQQRLVKLPNDPAFFRRLNHQLRKLDESGTRRPDFVGHAISDDVRVGMLVEDMRGGDSGQTVVHSTNRAATTTTTTTTTTTRMYEIKPKWLVQSPRAPRGAEQCRNCAREVWRNMKNKTKNPVFCPLNLVKAADFARDDEQHIARDIAADLRRCYKMTEHEARNLTAWLRSCELLQRLRRIQWDNDHTAHITDDDAYSLAMTLRDCSLFVLVPSAPNAPPGQVVAKLGDTDMKNFAVKKDYWVKMEKEFHDSGVYWNTDKLSVSITDCQLPFYRSRRTVISGTELGRFYPAV